MSIRAKNGINAFLMIMMMWHGLTASTYLMSAYFLLLSFSCYMLIEKQRRRS